MTTKSIFLSGLLAVVFAGAGCNSKDHVKADPLLAKCWTHAFEEDGQDNNMIFRPCLTHTFPAPRYRHTFTLNENGEAEYSVLAPNDAHTTEQGKWSYDSASKKLKISNQENAAVHVYEVLEINEDLLRLKE